MFKTDIDGVTFSFKELLRDSLPKAPGVYIFRDASSRILYVGKAVSLRSRVSSYFQNSVDLGPKTRALVAKIAKIEHIVVSSEIEALILESDLIKRWRPPYNISLKDDKFYQYIKVEKPVKNAPSSPMVINEKTDLRLFPVVSTVRRPKLPDRSAYYFGPFPSGAVVGQVLKSLRRIFLFRYPTSSRLVYRSALGRAFAFNRIGDNAVRVSPAEYNANLRRLIKFLKSGQKDPIIAELKREMSQLSREQKYEAASAIRDQIERFEYVTQSFRPAKEFLANPNLVADTHEEALDSLFVILSGAKNLSDRIEGILPWRQDDVRIEAYDISHFGGKQMVGSLVVFVGGVASKQDYRRFKIKTLSKIDDTATLQEVLRRRFKNDWPLPQILLVDGGKLQVAAAKKVLRELKLTSQIVLIGLAKRQEEIITASGDVIKLPRNSPALKLLQNLRNEAHRFANSYRHKLTPKLC